MVAFGLVLLLVPIQFLLLVLCSPQANSDVAAEVIMDQRRQRIP